MTNHVTTVYKLLDGWHARCTCRQTLPQATEHHWQAEDWSRAHLEIVERVRTHLAGQPSLKSSRTYFRAMAEDVRNSVEDRQVWKQLADEADHRVNDLVPVQQDGLFELP